MTKRSIFSILAIIGVVTIAVSLAVAVFLPEKIAAYNSTEVQQITSSNDGHQFAGDNNQSTTPLSATQSMLDINNTVVALVMQPGEDKLHAFNALTGEWATLEGPNFRVEGDDIAIVSNLAILVSQPGQDALHAFSALTGEWATLDGPDFRVGADDILKVNDSVIIVSQPGQEKIHAYSALTGEWATLGGVGFKVAPGDTILVGPKNEDLDNQIVSSE